MNFKSIVLFLLMILTAFQGFSLEESKEPNILVYTHSNSSAAPTEERQYYNTAISEYLQLHSFNAIIIDNESAITELLDTAGWLGAFFLIEADYSEKNLPEPIVLRGYSTWNSENIVTVDGTGGELPFLMAQVVEVLESYLQTDEVQALIAELEAGIPAEAVEESEVIDKPEAVEDPEVVEATEPVEETEDPEKSEEKVVETSGEASSDTGKLLFSIGFAPFIATFQTTEYFNIGYSAFLFGGYIFPMDNFNLIAGGKVEMTFFDSEGTLDSSRNIISSAGLSASVESAGQSITKSVFNVSGGLSFFTADTLDGSFYTAFMPYLSTGIGMELKLVNPIFLSIGIDYTIYIEKTIILNGFLPSIALQFRI